jgi:hypothetical protein
LDTYNASFVFHFGTRVFRATGVFLDTFPTVATQKGSLRPDDKQPSAAISRFQELVPNATVNLPFLSLATRFVASRTSSYYH